MPLQCREDMYLRSVLVHSVGKPTQVVLFKLHILGNRPKYLHIFTGFTIVPLVVVLFVVDEKPHFKPFHFEFHPLVVFVC